MHESTDALNVGVTTNVPVAARPGAVPRRGVKARSIGSTSLRTPEPASCTLGLARLLSVRDVAETLAVSVRQVWKLVSLGELPVVRIGRCARFDPRDVQAWIERRKEARR
jgi:excisionase family DNA binding protein